MNRVHLKISISWKCKTYQETPECAVSWPDSKAQVGEFSAAGRRASQFAFKVGAVHNRFKRRGQFWTRQGLGNLAALEQAHENKHWEQLWVAE